MAGNANSGSALPFRVTENELRKKIEEFRQIYGSGENGMVTWPRFCAYLGYSVEEVRECYVRGKKALNAYSGRADLLGRFRTEVKAMTLETGEGKISLAKLEAETDYLTEPGPEAAPPDIRIFVGNGDSRWIEAMK